MITRNERWVAVFAASAVSAILFIYYLARSHLALFSLNNGVDWAHHTALIDSIIHNTDQLMQPQLGGFANVPRAAHLIAAAVAILLRLSSLQAIQIVANAAVIVSCAVVSLRLVTMIGDERKRSAMSDLMAFSSAIAAFIFFKIHGLSFSGQLQWNYFFHEAVGTAAAFIFLTAIQWLAADLLEKQRAIVFVAIPICSWILANFHTVPAIWFAASGCACILGFPYTWWKRLLLALVTGLVSAAAIFSLFSSRDTLAMGQTVDSDFNIVGLRLSHAPLLLLLGGLALLILLSARFFMARTEVDRLFNVHAGAVGLAVMALAFAADYIFKPPTSFYAYAKPAYIYAAELSFLIGGIVNHLTYRAFGGVDWKPFFRLPLILLGVLGGTLAQGVFVKEYVSDQHFLVATQKAIVNWPKPIVTAYPLFNVFSAAEKYYLFIAPLGQPHIVEAMRLLTDPRVDRDPVFLQNIIPPHMLKGAIQPWSGKAIELADGARQFILLFTGAWSKQPDGVRWLSGPEPARLFAFAPQYRSMRVCLRFTYNSWSQGTLKIRVNSDAAVNEKIAPDSEAKTINLPISVSPQGDIDIEFTQASSGPTPGVRMGVVRLLPNCPAEQ